MTTVPNQAIKYHCTKKKCSAVERTSTLVSELAAIFTRQTSICLHIPRFDPEKIGHKCYHFSELLTRCSKTDILWVWNVGFL